MKLFKPKEFSGRTHVPVDPCIAPLVQALNDGGIQTEASCCGYGNRPGSIILEDKNRWLFISSDYEEGQKIDKIHSKAGYKSMGGE